MARLFVQITFEGLNINRTLNNLSAKYTVGDIRRNGKICQITVKSAECIKVLAFLHERCYNVTEVKKIGTGAFLQFAQKHCLLALCLVLTVAVLAVSCNFCWKVQVSGDYTAEEVAKALEVCNVGIGSYLAGFDADKVENSLATQLDAMYATVCRKGSTLYVSAVKKKLPLPSVDMHRRRDIVATFSGKVISLLCEQGTPAVKVGDVVKQGDTLVYGLRTYNDGTTQEVYALGKVVLQLSQSAFAPYTGSVQQQVATGNTFTANAVVLFGKLYSRSCPFEHCETQTVSVQLFPLNLTVQRIVYSETVVVETPVTLEQCLEQLKQQALQQATQQANFEVKSSTFRVDPAGVTATVYGNVEVN